MSSLILPILEIGMVVITPTSNIRQLTEDKKYIIQDIEGDWILLTNDLNEARLYKSHLFMEPDVYYNMLLYLTLLRLFNFKPNQLK